MRKIIFYLPVILAICACCGDALAHDATHAQAWQWTLNASFAWPLSIACGWYVAGCLRLRKEGNLYKMPGLWRIGGFAGGVLALAVALASPLDRIAEHLFSAHMIQHLILIIVAPPLLVCGRPVFVWMWAFPISQRRIVAFWWNRNPITGTSHAFLTRPWMVWAMASIVLLFWHLPAPHAWALGHENVHIIEHSSFLATSLALWTLLAKPYGKRRTSHWPALLAVSTFSLYSGFLGALLTLAARPLYPGYDASAYGMSALEDQQLAGIIMWVPMGLVHVLTLALLFADWMKAAETRQKSAWRRRHGATAIPDVGERHGF